MDKKSIVGLIIIGLIFFGFSWYSGNQQQKVALERARIDSINKIELLKTAEVLKQAEQQALAAAPKADSASIAAVKEQEIKTMGSLLYTAMQGTEKTYTLSNDKVIVSLSNKGAQPTSVELKDFKRYDGSPLYLFKKENSLLDLNFFTTQSIKTANFFFEAMTSSSDVVIADKQGSLAFRLYVDSLSYVEYCYTLSEGSYMVDFSVDFVNMANHISPLQTDMILDWKNTSPQQERGFTYENQYTTLAYSFPAESNIEELSVSTESKSENISTKLEWVAFKQQFFSSILISKDNFLNGDLAYTTDKEGSGNIKNFSASLKVPYSLDQTKYEFSFYFGPNDYKLLKSYDSNYQKLIPLGWGIMGWINRFLVIPSFDFLGKFISNYGWIIFFLTLFIKLIIFPFTYKSYLSMAKMRLLKPELDEIGARYPKKEDAMKKQQAMMELYKRAGVSPMGGCLPMLLQLPILVAMFRFFPASIELRQEHFLWATDLSSYDSIFTLPFSIPFYGDHVSLFALLMGVSVFISSKISFAQNSASSQQLPGMQFMMLYLMPIMLLAWFNNYSSGLSYYYLLSNVITIIQSLAFRRFVSDEKLHKRMKDNAKKPQKKSKWMAKYDQMLKQQQQISQQKKR